MHHLLIIGCGDIGQRVARLWNESGTDIFGMVRNPAQEPLLNNLCIRPVAADLDRPATLKDLPVKAALIYYFAPPPDNGDDDPRMRAFVQLLGDQNLPHKIVYISTTGVYGHCDGGWVTEQSLLNPQTTRGKRRLAAERILMEWHKRTAIPVVILRVAGIYGPGRLPIERLQSGQPVLDEKEAPYSNRIHADDLARVCLYAAQLTESGYRVYNVSDGHPTTMTDYFNRVAKIAGLKPPRIIPLTQAAQEFSPMMMSFLNESKRVDNHKMLAELGITLLYPDLETGLEHCMSGQ